MFLVLDNFFDFHSGKVFQNGQLQLVFAFENLPFWANSCIAKVIKFCRVSHQMPHIFYMSLHNLMTVLLQKSALELEPFAILYLIIIRLCIAQAKMFIERRHFENDHSDFTKREA